LNEAIDDGADLPVTALVGLPGSGKTVALLGWWNARARPEALWISCDARDRDPVTFWSSVVTALRSSWPDRFTEAADLLALDAPDLDEVAIVVVNDLALLAEPVTLVIDDFTFAAAAASSVAFFVDRAPAGVRLVLSCRSDPRIELPRLRVRGRVREIRQDRLEFTVVETTALLAAYGIDVDPEQAVALQAGTDGWAAALQLAALTLRAGTPIDELLAELSRSRALADYLVAEVLERQPDDLRDFLLETSILEELEAETCDVIRARSDARRMLQRVADGNLFLLPVAPGGIYRYHHLFRDLLRSQLRAREPQRAVALHRRAAEWFQSQQRFEAAFHHLLQAPDIDRAFALLGEQGLAIYFGSDARAVHRMIAEAETVAPRVGVTARLDHALALSFVGFFDQADWWIDGIRRDPGAHQLPPGRLPLVRSLIASHRGAVEDAAALVEEAAEQLDAADQLYAGVPAVRIRTRLWLGDPEAALDAYEASRAHEFANPAVVPVLLQGGAAWAACVEGSLHAAEALANDALRAAARLGLGEHPSIVEPLRTLARIAFEHGELARAEATVERALMISETTRPSYALLDLLVLARVQMADGRLLDAARAIERAGRAVAFRTGPLAELRTAAEARLAVLLGDVERADALASSLSELLRRSLLQARIAVARGQHRAALACLAESPTTTKRQRLDVALTRVRCEAALGDNAFEEHLAAVLSLAHSEGYVQPLLEDLAESTAPVSCMLRAGEPSPWQQRVLASLDRTLPSFVQMPENAAGVSQPLSPRELQVLRYLGSRLTNAEIAQELYISLNTVRTHIAAVYRKLGVSSRRDAIETARALGLAPR
jgi:LuxR family maltose regulon positive regulatory protein